MGKRDALGTMLRLLAAGVALVLVALAGLPAAAQGNDDCLACHEDPDLVGTRDGKEIQAFVDRGAFEGSIHGAFECVDCHADVSGVELPHADDLARVDCAACHDDVAAEHAGSIHAEAGLSCADCHGSHTVGAVAKASPSCGSCHARQSSEHARSLHGRAQAKGDELAPNCVTCHTAHAVRPHTDTASPTAVMNIPLLCGRCHREGSPVSLTHDIPQDRILENYSMSIHGEGLFRQGLTVTAVCTSCHTSHLILPHTDPQSSINIGNVAKTCAKCHGQIEQVHRQVIEGRLWAEEPHKIPACVDCHAPHKVRRVFYPAGLANRDCLSCHGDRELTTERKGRKVSLYVDDSLYAQSVHAATACAQCHTEVTPAAKRPCESIDKPVDCSVCHAEQVADFKVSTHGTLLAQGDQDAPSCQDCHVRHATMSKEFPDAPTFARNVPQLCARCHRAGEQAAVRIEADVPDIVQGYMDSIHGKGLVDSGLLVTATCANCHTAHRELPPDDPESTVHTSNVADTCGNCHHGIEETFRTSIHWPGNAETDRELPTCEDCHSSHSISRTGDADARLKMMDQCGRCHEKEAETFFDTFHGKVSRLGTSGAAMCYDCHGTHDILPPTSLTSTLGRDRVVETCGKCHEGSHRRFAGYLTHATHHDAERYPWLFWSFWGMTALLVGTLTFAIAHTLAWLVRLWLSRDEWRAAKARAHAETTGFYRRFDSVQRTQHMVMLLSFFTLAITGMALKFSYATWAQWVASLVGGFDTTGVLHRIGAIVLFCVFCYHLYDVRRRKKREGQTWLQMISGPNSILFQWKDARELLQSVRWFFGLGPRPQYGRYTYWEKFDYFAVFWGVMVIGSTGLVLWFPETFTHIIPGWSVNVATVIHSDEALLAVAFIFTIHFFNTHFRPDKFPMDMGMFTGRVPLAELAHDKPAEYAALMAREDRDQHIVTPFPKPVVRAFRVFGISALVLGLTLIALIVYAMIFSYR